MRIETPEQRSKDLQRAQRELHEAQQQHSKSLEQLRRARAAYAATNHGLSDPASEAGRENKKALAALREKINAALAERDAARQAVDAAKQQAASAEREACKAVGDKHRPAYLQKLKAFVIAKLESIEPLAVAAAEAVEVREAARVALGVRREHYARMQPALGLLQDHERFEQLRAETVESIEAGVISAKDLPGDLKKVWNL